VAVASLVVGIAGNASGLLDLETPAGVLFSLTVGTAVYAVLVLGLVVRPGALSWADMGWPRRDPPADPGSASAAPTRYVRDVAIAMGVVAPTYIGSAFLGGLLAMALGVTLTSPLPAPSSSMETVATILGALFLAPIGEELFFRGFALTAWWRDLGARAALVRTTLLFAVVHVLNVSSSTPDEFLRMAILQVVVILPVGYVLGRLAISRGMVAAIAGHATFNGIALFLLLAVGRA
jgi:membrane protease YdiL (CAAX protease family)